MYRFLNPNPISARVGDCVVRAVSIVTDQHMDAIKALYPKEYDAVIRRITDIGNA